MRGGKLHYIFFSAKKYLSVLFIAATVLPCKAVDEKLCNTIAQELLSQCSQSKNTLSKGKLKQCCQSKERKEKLKLFLVGVRIEGEIVLYFLIFVLAHDLHTERFFLRREENTMQFPPHLLPKNSFNFSFLSFSSQNT